MPPTVSSGFSWKKLLAPIVFAVAVVYFLIDAIFALLLRPLSRWIARLPLAAKLGIWVASLGPYPTLLLFAVPLAILEPIKPVGAVLIATGHAVFGISLIVGGEIVKVAILERLFAISKDKLLGIPLFAWCYNWVIAFYDYVRSFGLWRMMLRWVGMIKLAVRRLRPRRRSGLR